MIVNSIHRSQSFWVTHLPSEILIKIFFLLNLQHLFACERVCRQWQEVSRDRAIYFALAKRFHYFYRKDGPAYFKQHSRQRFIKFYRQIQGHTLKEYANYLPEFQEFAEPFVQKKQDCFADFKFDTIKLLAYLHLGGGKYEKGLVNRPLLLGCYFGDLNLVKTVFTIEEIEPKPLAILAGMIYAEKGGHEKIVIELKTIGRSLKSSKIVDAFWNEFLQQHAKFGEIPKKVDI